MSFDGAVKRLPVRKLALISTARGILENACPEDGDCGKRCGKACCRGDGEIWLLPHERHFYEDNGFGSSRNGMYTVKEYKSGGKKLETLVCRGSCEDCRDTRPYWCRVFPCFPSVSVDGDMIDLRMRLDVRGNMCPFVTDGVPVSGKFADAVAESVFVLAEDDAMLRFLTERSAFYGEIEELGSRLSAHGPDADEK